LPDGSQARHLPVTARLILGAFYGFMLKYYTIKYSKNKNGPISRKGPFFLICFKASVTAVLKWIQK